MRGARTLNVVILSMTLAAGFFVGWSFGDVPTTAPSTQPGGVEPADAPMTHDQAMKLLLGTDTFADAYVGFAGSLSDQVKAFRVLVAGEKANEDFARLVETASTAGRLYGLSGLFLKDREAFRAAYPRFSQSNEKVRTFSGCIMAEREVAGIARDILGGDYPRQFAPRPPEQPKLD